MDKTKRGPETLYRQRAEKMVKDANELNREMAEYQQRHPKFIQGTVEPKAKK